MKHLIIFIFYFISYIGGGKLTFIKSKNKIISLLTVKTNVFLIILNNTNQVSYEKLYFVLNIIIFFINRKKYLLFC